MSIAEGMIQEMQMESPATRRVLERITDAQWDWKPHEKSMGFGQLGSHIAETFGWMGSILEDDELVIDMESYVPYIADSQDTLLKFYDEKVEEACALLAGKSDEQLSETWKMVTPDGHVMMEMPRAAIIKMFMLTHTVHHRGQLSVYLRLNDIPVPSIYGPSADEQPAG